jgi:hypothetical protein
MFISQAFNVTPEQAVKWVIFIIIFVFDPLAICLLLAGNFLIEQRKNEKRHPEENVVEIVAPPPAVETPLAETPQVEVPQPAGLGTANAIIGQPIVNQQPNPTTESPVMVPVTKKSKSKSKKVKSADSHAEVIIDTSSPPVKSSLEDVMMRNDRDVVIEMDERYLSSQIRGMYEDKSSAD